MQRSVANRLSAWIKPHPLGDALIRRNPFLYSGFRRYLDRMAVAGLSERREATVAGLSGVLAAARRSPYGRRSGGGPDLSTWPFLEKESVRERPGDFLSVWPMRATRALTSGTTGMPLELFRSFRSVCFEQVCLDLLVERAGIDPRTARTVVLRGDDIKPLDDEVPPFWRLTSSGRRLVLSTNHLRSGTLADYRSAWERFRPVVLLAYPSAAEQLCDLLRRSSACLSVQFVLTSSEILTADARRLIEEQLGARLIDYYGQAERVAFATSTTANEYFFLPGYAIVELRPCGDPDRPGLHEIVGTSLWNRAMPLVRYRTGDLIDLERTPSAQELEEITCGLRPFAGVIGRSGDYLVSPDGARLVGIDHIPRGVLHVRRCQLVQQSPSRVRIRVLAAPGFSAADEHLLMENARRKLPNSIEVTIEVADELARTPQGKVPFVIHGESGRSPADSTHVVSD
jgi:phenylacetate-coenzyme A ligase PaaK-like adenylate-forming protein